MSEPRMWRRGPDGEIVRARPEQPPDTRQEPSPGGSRGRPVSLRLALRLWIRDTYDHLGAVLVMSGLWTFLVSSAAAGGQAVGIRVFGGLPGSLPLFLSVLAALLAFAAVGGPLCAGLFRFARNACARSEPEIFDFAWGFRGAMRRSVGLALLQVLVFLLLAGNGYWYLLEQKHPLLVVLGALFGYFLLFWSLMVLYQWPLLAELPDDPLRIVKKSALLALDNFGFTLGLGVVVLVLTGLLWVTMVGGVLLWAGSVAILVTQATRELLRKYDLLPPDPTLDPIADETHEFGGRGWHE